MASFVNLGVGKLHESKDILPSTAVAPKAAIGAQLSKEQLELIQKIILNKEISADEADKFRGLVKTYIESKDTELLQKINALITDKKTLSKLTGDALLKATVINTFAQGIIQLNKDHEAIRIVEEKLLKNKTLGYRECFLVDTLDRLKPFIDLLGPASNNEHITRIKRIQEITQKQAWSEYQDGDLLFFDHVGRNAYFGDKTGILDSIVLSALDTRYTHVGVFYRNTEGRGCVAEISGEYRRTALDFGDQSYIRGKRIDPTKLTNVPLTEAEKVEVQKRIGDIFSTIAATTKKIKISRLHQIGCVLSHQSGDVVTELGKVKVEDNTSMMCSEFVAKALMEAFHEFNSKGGMKFGDKTVLLKSPFDPSEQLEFVHPERLLVAFGPNQDSERLADSAWEDVVTPPQTAAILPTKPDFPLASYPKSQRRKMS